MPLTLRHRAEIERCARMYPKRRLTPEGRFWALYVVVLSLAAWWLS